MTYKEQVDLVLASYKGMSFEALSLGPDEWAGFLSETGLKPDELGNVDYHGVTVTAGMSGIKYITS